MTLLQAGVAFTYSLEIRIDFKISQKSVISYSIVVIIQYLFKLAGTI